MRVNTVSSSCRVKFFESVLDKFVINKSYTTAYISDDGDEAETPGVLLKVPFMGKCSMKFASVISNTVSCKVELVSL